MDYSGHSKEWYYFWLMLKYKDWYCRIECYFEEIISKEIWWWMTTVADFTSLFIYAI